MISFLFGIIGVITLLYLALIFESTAFALAGYGLAVLVVLSFIMLMIRGSRIKVKIEIPINVAEKNKKLMLNVKINNSSFFSLPRVRFRIEYGNTVDKKRKKVYLTADGIRKGESTRLFAFAITRSGNFEFSIKKIKIYDFTGLFSISKKVRGNASAMVLPDIDDVAITIGDGVRHFFGEAMSSDELSKGSNPEEVIDVREFRDGDRIQNVHWKLSARTDELMVKEHMAPKACPIVLMLAPGSTAIDGVPEWAASLSFSLMDMKCTHYAAWFSKSRNDVVRVRVKDEEDYYLFMTSYMQDDGASQVDIKERYREKYKGEQYLHLLCPKDKNTVIVDGETLKTDEISKLELLLR